MEKGGFAETAINAFKENADAIYQSWCDYATKYGSEELFAGRTLEGLRFESDKVPLGWNSTKLPGGVYKPARIKASMEAYKELNALESRPGMFDLANALKVGTVAGGGLRGGGFSLSGPSYETVGDLLILDLPEGSDIPEGATKMKTSAYWMLVEDAANTGG